MHSARPSLINNPRVRGVVYQAVLVIAVFALGYGAISNALSQMAARGIPTDFSFWNNIAGFDVSQALIPFAAADSTYGRAFLVGLLNTLLVASLGIVFATVIGVFVGIARLSKNWMVARLAQTYVEVLRNIPLLLQLFFLYNAVLKPLPVPRQALVMPAFVWGVPSGAVLLLGLVLLGLAAWLVWAKRYGTGIVAALGALAVLLFGARLVSWALPVEAAALLGQGALMTHGTSNVFLTNRGLFYPELKFLDGSQTIGYAAILAVILCVTLILVNRARRARVGRDLPVGLLCAALVIGLPTLAYFAAGPPIATTPPVLKGFNFSGGWRISPEFATLLIGLSLYTATFIAEIVRSGIEAVQKGQAEAAHALGLSSAQTLKLVVLPQALRVIIPPLTSQYLNLTKNSSLAVFIGYPDLVQMFMGTVLNQTGAAVQVVLITMAVYLVISLLTSLFMNIYNARVALVER